MTSMTPEEIRQHVGEVWEDDYGITYRVIAFDNDEVVYRAYEGKVCTCDAESWLSDNTLPQSLRKAKPRMVKAPGWKIWGSDGQKAWMLRGHREDDTLARNYAAFLEDKLVAIQAPDSDEMEVVKGFEGN